MGYRLLLASQSPRRRELLAAAGFSFRVVASRGREYLDPQDPLMTAEANARAKVEGAVIPQDERAPFVVVGADTIVECEGRILGKPVDRDEARSMIELLAGRRHTVISGLAIKPVGGGGGSLAVAPTFAGCAQTDVWFRDVTDRQIEAYLDAGEWHDKAGAYGIQGRAGLLVERIEGDYFTVVGLPLALLVSLLEQAGIDALADI